MTTSHEDLADSEPRRPRLPDAARPMPPTGRRTRSPRARRSGAVGIAAVGLAALLTGCGLSIPADVDGTLERVRDGELRVGITHNPPWTDTSADPAGSEVRLVTRLASELDAEVVWTEASEAVLADALHRGELDLAVGGFLDDTPWTDRAAATSPFLEDRDERGETRKHVLLTPLGENRFLITVEDFLRSQRSER